MFVAPMLLEKEFEPFDDKNYLTELKLDGIRLELSNIEETRLYTRHKTDVTARFPEIHYPELPKGTILDGELILPDENGKPDFEGLMSRFHVRNREKIKRLARSSPATYCAFDILYHQGQSVCYLPLIERKKILDEVLKDTNGQITKVSYNTGDGISYFDVVRNHGLEGIVLKRKDSLYEVGKRSESWIKVKNYQYIDVIITGFKKKDFSWLVSYEDGRYAGTVELVGSKEARRALFTIADQLKIKETDNYVYLKPVIKCKVRYLYETKKGLLREPSFVEFIGINNKEMSA